MHFKKRVENISVLLLRKEEYQVFNKDNFSWKREVRFEKFFIIVFIVKLHLLLEIIFTFLAVKNVFLILLKVNSSFTYQMSYFTFTKHFFY